MINEFNEIMSKAHKFEDDCIKEVLRQLLKREPTLDDAKKCSRIVYENNSLEYELYYDGILLGAIKKILEDYKFNIEFIPAK